MFWQDWFTPQPFNSGFLPEKDGHLVYFAEFGNKKGVPVIFFHGGPGGSCKAKYAKTINLRKYRAIMVDQRGCGQSQPLGKLEHNTTQDLLDDIDRLLEYLNIKDRVILRGASWGSTLALLWAERHPQRVAKMLLSQVFLANQDFHHWEFGGSRYLYPEFVSYMEEESSGKTVTYYNKLIQSDNLQEQLTAANHYGWFERICGSMNPAFGTFTELSEKELASQRIYMYYAANNFFLSANEILDNIGKINEIEACIIHNRLDLIAPLKGAWDVHCNLRNSQLTIVPDFGHVSKLLNKTIINKFKRVLKK